jgi:hypothetical protein
VKLGTRYYFFTEAQDKFLRGDAHEISGNQGTPSL